VTEPTVCLDTSVWIKALTGEEPEALSAAAAALLASAFPDRLVVAPAFLWTEVGSVLRRKLRLGLLTVEEATAAWDAFQALPVAYRDGPAVRARAWELAAEYGLPTLYDAAFLACAEAEGPVDFWTADERLVAQLGDRRPAYVRVLGRD
jgi:predicted nucleic acid-binding protein